jgi:hypothetical protein
MKAELVCYIGGLPNYKQIDTFYVSCKYRASYVGWSLMQSGLDIKAIDHLTRTCEICHLPSNGSWGSDVSHDIIIYHLHSKLVIIWQCL